MKKILILILCFLIVSCVPISAFAEDVPAADEEVVTEENTAEDATEDSTQEDTAGTEEPPVEEENAPSEELPQEPPSDDSEGFDVNNLKQTVSGAIKEWIEPHVGEIGVIVTLIGYGISLYKKFKTVNKNMGTMNNNAITISENSTKKMEEAQAAIQAAANAITGYEEKIKRLLEEYQNTAEDKKRLEAVCVELKEYLNVSTLANKEFADELVELLVLANIPNFKKEEIGARHLARVKALEEAEEHARHAFEASTSTEEVKENVGEEA